MKGMKVRVTFTEPLLGTASGNPDVQEEFVASKAPDAMSIEEEVAAIGVANAIEKRQTIFPVMDDGTPFMWDYQWKGFFKESCGFLRKATGSRSAGLKAFKKTVDGLVFVMERRVPLHLPEGTVGHDLPTMQRPLRAETPQGPRVALASSEMVPAGTWCEFTVAVLDDTLLPYVEEWLDYGALHGVGQWRNGSWGRFEWEPVEEG